MFRKIIIHFILLSLGLFSVVTHATQEEHLQRVYAISEYTIKMQTLDEHNPQKITQKLAELMVGNRHDPIVIRRFTDPIPVEGIANYLRKSNLQGLSLVEAKQMKPVIEEEIQQISSMFRSCKIDSNIQKTPTHYFVDIICRVPKLNINEKNIFQQQVQQMQEQPANLQKIHYLNAKQKIFAKSEYQDFKSTLWIQIEEKGILRAVIENEDYFPNAVINQRDQALGLGLGESTSN
ncbi:hypothetical protein [Acinetobacter defluvii]|uniref:hypothetical protein n=1 Tax=Acinetobacter defluvii TaxID=1871111 RepID=UPI003AF6955D